VRPEVQVSQEAEFPQEIKTLRAAVSPHEQRHRR